MVSKSVFSSISLTVHLYCIIIEYKYKQLLAEYRGSGHRNNIHYLVFNMCHVQHIEISIRYLTDTPLNFPYHIQQQLFKSPSLSPKRRIQTDRQKDVQTHISILCMKTIAEIIIKSKIPTTFRIQK